MPRWPMTSEQRFWSKVRPLGNGCWQWTGACDRWGYGRFKVGKREHRAHRWIYEHVVGPIPDGLTLDHVRVRGCVLGPSCVNWQHLEPVTLRENVLRGDTIAARHAAKTHCVHGHEFTPDNLVPRRDGARHCRTCHNDRRRARRARGRP